MTSRAKCTVLYSLYAMAAGASFRLFLHSDAFRIIPFRRGSMAEPRCLTEAVKILPFTDDRAAVSACPIA